MTRTPAADGHRIKLHLRQRGIARRLLLTLSSGVLSNHLIMANFALEAAVGDWSEAAVGDGRTTSVCIGACG
jgi:hypothetical protein